MKREHKPTSKAGESFIKPHKPSHRQKIVEALTKLRVGGNHEQIAEVSGLRPDQVWKRLSELERDDEIFDTGITRPLKSTVAGIVWQLKKFPVVDPLCIKTDRQAKDLKRAGIITHSPQLGQSTLFP